MGWVELPAIEGPFILNGQAELFRVGLVMQIACCEARGPDPVDLIMVILPTFSSIDESSGMIFLADVDISQRAKQVTVLAISAAKRADGIEQADDSKEIAEEFDQRMRATFTYLSRTRCTGKTNVHGYRLSYAPIKEELTISPLDATDSTGLLHAPGSTDLMLQIAGLDAGLAAGSDDWPRRATEIRERLLSVDLDSNNNQMWRIRP